MMTFNHGLSGYVVARVAEPLAVRYSPIPAGTLALCMFLGAMVPDLDIISRLGGYHAYFGQSWYSHRQFTHSILGTGVIGLLLGLLTHRLLGRNAPGGRWAHILWLGGAFWVGGMIHIFGDLFTPGWKMPVFWPMDVRYGGFRKIGWFSPYLLWLFVGAILLSWGLRKAGGRIAALRPWSPTLIWLINALAVYRWVHFIQINTYNSWEQWLDYNRALLPEFMVTPITDLVRVVWSMFTR